LLNSIDKSSDQYFGRGVKALKPLLRAISSASGDLDYNSYLKSVGMLPSPTDYAPKLSSVEVKALYLLWRLDLVVRAYSPVWDWVVEDPSRYSFSSLHQRRSVEKFLKLTASDIKKGRINDATKRIISYLTTVIFKPLYPSKCLPWEASGNELLPLIIHLKPKSLSTSSDLGRYDLEKVFNLSAEVLVVAEDKVAIKYLLGKRSISPTPEIMEALIFDAISAGDMTSADRYLEMLDRLDPHNPKTVKFRADVERSKRISSLARSTGQSFEEIREMSGTDFEDLVIRCFKNAGYATQSTPASGDFGADAIINTASDTRIVVQCKRYKARLNLKAVQEVMAAMSHYGADYGIVITTNGYLKSAVELAKSADIELWGQDEVIDFLAGDLRFSSIREL